jgi:hypothetical protein
MMPASLACLKHSKEDPISSLIHTYDHKLSETRTDLYHPITRSAGQETTTSLIRNGMVVLQGRYRDAWEKHLQRGNDSILT